jgi:hypothetical protein
MTHKHNGQWFIGGKRKVIYGATRLQFAERVKAAQALVDRNIGGRPGRQRRRRARARSSLDRAPDYESGGQGFESLPARQFLTFSVRIARE